ncbi:MAG: PilN domain-containing protein [Candidatus Omnitrophica bacterium]|nr:PilN domain-containing protein [Candidatus Omnitrophota bacterium]
MMIEINLLPDELKKSKTPSGGLGKPDVKTLLYIVPVVIGILLVTHIFLAATSVFKNLSLASLNKKLSRLDPEKKKLEGFFKEYSVASAGASAATELLGGRVEWAQELNSISRALPAGVWLNELSFQDGILTLRGSVIAVNKEKEEVSIINKFISNLKKDKDFIAVFQGLELSSVNRRAIHSFEVSDFILTGREKTK